MPSRPHLRSVIASLLLLGGIASVAAVSVDNPAHIPGTRTTSMLNHIPGLRDLPKLDEVHSIQRRQANTSFNLNDIQFDVIVGQLKRKQQLVFFSITNATVFKSKLAANIAPIITSAQQMMNVSTQPLVAVNVAFSQSGLNALNVNDNIGASELSGGMYSQNFILGDTNSSWLPQLTGTTIHGVFMIVSDTTARVNQQMTALQNTLGSSIVTRHTLLGESRASPNEGKEMFGFLDGISQPCLVGICTPNPGQMVSKPGVIIFGMDGDSIASARPTWTYGGSVLVFRQLEQKVPEFNKFLLDNAPPAAGLTIQQRADKFGARLMGRWKSGAPVDLFPDADNPSAGTNPALHSNFDYNHTTQGFDFNIDQTHCPFGAHIRQMRPRADATFDASGNMIFRSGIPYGPEVSSSEAQSNTTTQTRGFVFTAYQSFLNKGFIELQVAWANNVNAFGHTPLHGVDPIIGVPLNGSPTGARWITGMDPANPVVNITLPNKFVVPRGGEYFFTPPISALAGRLAQP